MRTTLPTSPKSQYLSLESRILFDGAGLAAAEHQLSDQHSTRVSESPSNQTSELQARNLAPIDRPADFRMSAEDRGIQSSFSDALPTSSGKTIVVIDSRVSDYSGLLEDVDPQAIIRVIGADENGLEVIGQLLGSTGEVGNLQILSHGQSGALMLGNRLIDNNALARSDVAKELGAWRLGMTADADILLLGCDVARGAKGQDFVQKLADLTQADISASVDDTGSTVQGGNWQLEFTVGDVSSHIAFTQASLSAYEHLLPAGPTTTLTVDPKPLIGSNNNNGSVTFLNTGTVGYAPYITLAFDQTGKDPSNTTPVPTEGVSYVAGSATYLGSALPEEHLLTFVGGVASSPSVTNAAGVPIVFNMSDYAGMQNGDQLVVLKLPLGSFVNGQPDATVNFKYNVGANTDSANTIAEGGGAAASALNITSRGFFALGDTPTGVGGAIQQGAATVASATPSWFTTAYENTSREREQVPGANDKQLFQALLNIAPGQTVVSDPAERFVSRLSIPSNIAFDIADIALRNNSLNAGPDISGTTYAVVDKVTGLAATQNANKTWSSPNGVEVRATAPVGTYTDNLTLNVGYFIPRSIISESTGDDVPQTFDAKHTGRVRFADSDDPQNQSFTADPTPIVLNYQTIQIQKSLAGPTGNALDAANPAGVRSGDVLTYTLNVQVGDFYGLRNVLVTDVLPDGIDYNSNATITINSNGETRTGSLASYTPVSNNTTAVTIDTQGAGSNSTLSVGGNGKWVLQFDISSFAAANSLNGSLPSGGLAGDLYGDVFKDASNTSLTTVTISYTGTVRDQYRVAANGNPATSTKLNENDVLTNNVWVSGSLIQNTGTLVAPSLVDTARVNSDTSTASASVKDGNLLLEIYAVNGIRVDQTSIIKDGSGRPIIAPGDNVTYRLRYDLTQGDYTGLQLTAYLPDPVFSATDANADGSVDAAGSAPGGSNFSKASDTVAVTGASANWAQPGRYAILGTGTNVAHLGSAGVAGVPSAATDSAYASNTISISTTALASGNSITFSLPNSNDPANPGGSANTQNPASANKVDLLFTVKAKDQSFADDLLLTAQGREVSERSVNGGVSTPTPLPDNRITPVVLGEPRIKVSHGVIATGALQQNGSVPLAGTVTAGSNSGLGIVAAAGTSSATPAFTGIISRAAQIDGNMVNIDANDTVRFGFAIENTGSSAAYNVRTQIITPPSGYRFVNGTDITDPANNLQVRQGDGTLLVQGTDYTVTGNVISFIDRDLNSDGISDSFFARGRIGASPRSDGLNVVLITYDSVADNGIAATAYAGATASSTVGVDRATGTLNVAGTNYLASPITDSATLQNAKPTADLRWQADSTIAEANATFNDSNQLANGAADDQFVIGESGYFDLKITIPEGATKSLFADINLPVGLRFDASFNGGTGYEIITTTAGLGSNGVGIADVAGNELAANFAGSISNLVPNAGLIAGLAGGTLGQPGVGARINLGDVTNPSTTATNDQSNNSFIIRVRVSADNQLANQQAATLSSGSSTLYSEGVNVLTGAGGSATAVAEVITANNPVLAMVDPTVTTVTTVAIVDIDSATPGDQSGTEADQFDVVEYTITLTNPGTIHAYDLALNDVFPSYLLNDASLSISDVISSGARVNGSLSTLTAANLSLNTATRTLGFNPANNIDLEAGGSIVIRVRGTLNSSVASVPSFSNAAETTWTSIDDVGSATTSGERSGSFGGPLLANGGTTIDAGTGNSSGIGANQTLTGAGLDNYRTASSASVPIVALQPVLSRIGGLSDTSPNANNNLGGNTQDGSPSGGVAQDMAVGEITRFRMVLRVPSGQLDNLALQASLPTGYTFLNDASARVAFVADTAMSSSVLSGVGLNKGDGSDGTGPVTGGNAAIFGSIQNNLTSASFSGADPRAVTLAPSFGISANTTSNGASLSAPRFELGTVNNTDNDIDNEYVVIEFNAIVSNVASNQLGTNLDTSFIAKVGAGAGTQLGNTSNITRDQVAEPYVARVDKLIVDIAAGPVTATNTLTFADSFSNTGNSPAYDVVLTDAGNPSAGTTNPSFISVTVAGTTYTSIAAAGLAGITVTANGNGFDVLVPQLNPGQSVSLRYNNDVPTNIAQPDNASTQATVRYSSIPGSNQLFAGSSAGAAASATGERDGSGAGLPDTAIAVSNAAGSLNNQLVRDGTGFGTLGGTLWDDTNTPNGVIEGGEKRLNGVTVSLLWAGADGVFGNADDKVLTTTTDVNGEYSFGALPGDDAATLANEGLYRITSASSVSRNDLDDSGTGSDVLTPRFDRTDGSSSGLNVAQLTLPVGTALTTRDFAYVQPNDAPVNSINASPSFPTALSPLNTIEDVPFAFSNANSALLTIADPDGNQGSGLLTTTLVVSNGSLAANDAGAGASLTGSGSATIQISGTQAQINAALATLVFTPSNNFSGAATLTLTTNDQGQGGNAGGDPAQPREAGGTASPDALQDLDVININVQARSDAPRLTIGTGPGANTSPASLGAGLGNSATQTVAGSATGLEDAAIPLGILIAPADTAGTAEAIPSTVTITGIPSGWVLRDSLGNDITAAAATGLTSVQAVGATVTPVADLNNTSASSATLTITVSSQDGAAPVATTTGTLTISAVNPANDRPVANTAPGAVLLSSSAEGDLNPPGASVSSMFAVRFSDPKDLGQPNGVDVMTGVLITGSAANATTEGAWQYSIDAGLTWLTVTPSISDSTAIYLRNSDLVRFLPVNSDFSGTPGLLTVRLVEDDQTAAGSITPDVPSGAAAGTILGTGPGGLNTTAGAVNNLTSALANAAQFASGIVSNPVTASTVITPVSDAPRLTIGTGAGQNTSPASAALGNDAVQTVSGATGGIEDNPIALGISIVPADTIGSTEAIPSTITITGVPAGWTLRDSLGNDITAAAATGLTPAQATGATITPATDVNVTGSLATLTITARSQDAGASPAVTTGTLSIIAVSTVNDAPSFSSTTPTLLASINEDSISPAVAISAAFPGFSDARDAGQSNGADNRVGVVLVANAANPGHGKWQYFDGTTWQDIPGNLSATNGLYLPDATQLRFNPVADYNGTPGALTARLVEDDQAPAGLVAPDLPAGATSAGFGATNVVRTGIDLSAGTGGATRISGNTRDASIVINPINDPPSVITPANTVATALPIGDVPITFTGPNSIRVGDLLDDPGNTGPVVRVTITPTSNGRPFMGSLPPGVSQLAGPTVGQLPGTPGIAIVLEGTLADINAALQTLQYRSAQFYNGLDTFTVAIDDRANGGPGPLSAVMTVNMDNLPLNDRPVVNGPVAPDFKPILPGENSPGRTVQELFGPRYTDPRDAPSPNGGDAFAGVAVISSPPASQGRYQYSVNGGSTWVDIAPGTTAANAVVLAPNAQLRFVASPAYVGEVDRLKAVLIETDQVPPSKGDLLGRADIPLDTPTSAAPGTGTILDLSRLEATESASTTNGIGRSRISSLPTAMDLGIRIDPPFVSSGTTSLTLNALTAGALPSVLGQAQSAAVSQFVGLTVNQGQAEAAAREVIARARFNSYLGNSGLQPNWLAPDGVPGIDPFASRLPELAAPPVSQTVSPPGPVAPLQPEPKKLDAVRSEKAAVDDDCAKPRVVAKPRAVNPANATPRFAPGSEAAKRFSDQIKRARVRARC